MGLMKSGSVEKKDIGDRIKKAVEVGSNDVSGKLKRYNIFLPINHMEQLDIIAKERGLKMADMVRQSIREFLEKN